MKLVISKFTMTISIALMKVARMIRQSIFYYNTQSWWSAMTKYSLVINYQ